MNQELSRSIRFCRMYNIKKKNNLVNLKKKKINYRKFLVKNTKLSISEITRLSYDLQSGTYVKFYNNLKKSKARYIYNTNMKNLSKHIDNKKTQILLDFGTGEGTKLPYILNHNKKIKKIFACDVSFNRLFVGYEFLKKQLVKKDLAKIILFCNKNFELPFKNNSIDVVFTAGVLENMSNNKMNSIVLELLRVTKKRLILLEPRSDNISIADLKRMKKFKLNFKLNQILKKNKINFIEDVWEKLDVDNSPYSIRIIDKKTKSSEDQNFYLKNENYPLKRINNFLYSKYGKIIPILNNIIIFRSLKNLYFFK